MKRIKYAVVALAALLATSCSDFLDTTPRDAISPSTTWKVQKMSIISHHGLFRLGEFFFHLLSRCGVRYCLQ